MNSPLFFMLAAASVLAGCTHSGITGDGQVATEGRPLSEISAITAMGCCEIAWSCGKPALAITGDRNLLPHIRTEVSGHTLKIVAPGILRPTQRIRIALASASLSDVRLVGSMSFTAAPLSASDLKLEATGASAIRLEGLATNLDVRMTGASKLDAIALQARSATLSLVGAPEADITVSDALTVSMTGAGALSYSGKPKTVDKSVTGASSIRQRP